MWWDIPQPIVDFSVGLGDVAIGATLGLVTGGGFTGPDARAALGIDGGVTESGAYINGVGAGLLATAGLGRLAMASEASATAKTGTSTASKTDFIVDSSGKAFPVPKDATGPVPVINSAGKEQEWVMWVAKVARTVKLRRCET